MTILCNIPVSRTPACALRAQRGSTHPTFALGIDTGGTYTDAVLVDHTNDYVLAKAKALTSYHDLSIGIGQAVAEVLEHTAASVSPADIDLVSLSTTLATNAIVEGRGCSVCLLLIGYDPTLIQQFGDGSLIRDVGERYLWLG
jgi:N-methylhydantoinase A/oxoprolinase/acetone carboxylase beta subunit